MSEITLAEVEEWRPVKGFERQYSVSSLGRVRSERFKMKPRQLIMKLKPSWEYLGVSLCTGKHHQFVTKLVHLLVLEAFVGPAPTPHHECNHIDGQKRHNVLGNLEWATKSQNQFHSIHVLGNDVLKGEAHANSTLKDDDIRQIRKMDLSGVRHCDIARALNTSQGQVWRILNGRAWKHVH